PLAHFFFVGTAGALAWGTPPATLLPSFRLRHFAPSPAMAPKGMKRPAAFAAEITTVKRALLMGDSGAALLAGMCSDSLGVPKSERHEFQASAVDMIADVVGPPQRRLQEELRGSQG
ncbi:unnamed protein product, partial [Prorocentrum cordatum]